LKTPSKIRLGHDHGLLHVAIVNITLNVFIGTIQMQNEHHRLLTLSAELKKQMPISAYRKEGFFIAAFFIFVLAASLLMFLSWLKLFP